MFYLYFLDVKKFASFSGSDEELCDKALLEVRLIVILSYCYHICFTEGNLHVSYRHLMVLFLS